MNLYLIALEVCLTIVYENMSEYSYSSELIEALLEYKEGMRELIQWYALSQ